MKKILIFLFIFSIALTNYLFAQDSENNAEKCYESLKIVKEAANKYATDHKLKSDTVFFDYDSLIKENYLDNKDILNCPITKQRYLISVKKGKCEVICLAHGTIELHNIIGLGRRKTSTEANKSNNWRDNLFRKKSYTDRYDNKKHFEIPIELIVYGGIPLIIIIILVIYFVRKRLIINYCEKNYFVYEENPISLTGTSEAFDVLCKGDSNYFTNGMYKKRGDIEINIIEFTAVTGHGKHRSTEKFTLCQLYKAQTEFPVFFMRSENVLLDSVGSMLGGQDIDFEEDNRFSNTFVLQGNDESEIRRFFNSKVRDAFVKNHKSGYCYESKGSCFLLYVKGHAGLKQKEVMLSTALRIFSIISTTGFKSNSMLKDIARNPKYYGKE